VTCYPNLPAGFGGLLGKPDEFARQVQVLFVSQGGAEGAGAGRSFHQSLEAAGIKYVYYESLGTAHEWQTWRKSLYQFAPLLFQN
jgi:enterochelin esterase family protein